MVMQEYKTLEDIRKYAKEKQFPTRATEELLRGIKTDENGLIDELSFILICSYIDDKKEYYEKLKVILDQHREEREKRWKGISNEEN